MNNLKLFVSFFAFFSYLTAASDIYLETEHQKGQGMLRAVGGKCFVYTPAHVVAKANDIYVNTRFEKDMWGELISIYPQDLALVKLADDKSSACSESSWRDGGNRVNAILDVITSGQLQFRHKNGRIEVFDIEITNKALHSTFDLKMKRKDNNFEKGMSGSIITIGDYPIGMLLSVEGDLATAIRTDTMTDVTKSVVMNYATEKEKIELGYYNQSNTSAEHVDTGSHKQTTPIIAKPSQSSEVKREQVFKGRISKGAEAEYKILARGVTSYRLINITQRDAVMLTLTLYDSAGNKVASKSRWRTDKENEWGFGVTDSGEYTLKADATKGSGNYALKLNILSTPEELVSSSNVLSDQDIVKGKLAKGAYAEYKILARGVTSYRLINITQRDAVMLTLTLYDSAGNKVASKSRWRTDNENEWGFGVTDSGEYTLKADATKGSGNYALKLNILSTPEELVSSSNVLSDQDIVKGKLAKGAYAEYKILARGVTSYRLINITQRDAVMLTLTLYDSAGNKVASKSRWRTDNENEWGFGVTDSGEYTLKAEATKGSGDYELKLEIIGVNNS